jgi:hypothetical protein
MVEERSSGLGRLDVPRTAVEKCDSQRVFQLLDGSCWMVRLSAGWVMLSSSPAWVNDLSRATASNTLR